MFFIVICPILDVSSFLFRNYFDTSFSISTFIRPIIPIIAGIYIFVKDKIRPQLILQLLFILYMQDATYMSFIELKQVVHMEMN